MTDSFEKVLALLAKHGPEGERSRARRALREYRAGTLKSEVEHQRILALAETLDDEGKAKLLELIKQALQEKAEETSKEWDKK